MSDRLYYVASRLIMAGLPQEDILAAMEGVAAHHAIRLSRDEISLVVTEAADCVESLPPTTVLWCRTARLQRVRSMLAELGKQLEELTYEIELDIRQEILRFLVGYLGERPPLPIEEKHLTRVSLSDFPLYLRRRGVLAMPHSLWEHAKKHGYKDILAFWDMVRMAGGYQFRQFFGRDQGQRKVWMFPLSLIGAMNITFRRVVRSHHLYEELVKTYEEAANDKNDSSTACGMRQDKNRRKRRAEDLPGR